MIVTLGVTDAITSLRDIHDGFGLERISNPDFFSEWQGDLPSLTATEQAGLARLKQRYLYYVEDGSITEGTIQLTLVSPLLDLLNFCDPPLKVKGEYAVKAELLDSNTRLQGYIDALVVQDWLWVVMIEAKRFGFNVSFAIPQALAYMMGQPEGSNPAFGAVTNGEDWIFIKLDRQQGGYATSDKFTLTNQRNDHLFAVGGILKRLRALTPLG